MFKKVVSPSVAIQSPVTLSLPLSKSLSNRLLIINALAGQQTPAALVANCDDTRAMIEALATTGDCEINVGAAGTAMRFLTAYFATRPYRTVTLDGTERMRQRPIGKLVDALRLLGADIRYLGREGFPPLLIRGRQLEGGGVSLDAGVSSQYTSALLMVGSCMKLGLELMLKGSIVSRPYIDMTLRMMEKRNAFITERETAQDVHEIRIAPRLYHLDNSGRPVEADWSAALYWYEVTALTGRPFILKGLSSGSLQGDSRVRFVFNELGVGTEFIQEGVRITKTGNTDNSALEVDLTECPDAAQTVAATCCGLGKPFVIKGLSTLPLKETDRLAAMQRELGKLGYRIEIINNDTLKWTGERCDAITSPVIATYHDHRMAMTIAPLAVVSGELLIDDPMVVTKSYPEFWDDLSRAGYGLTDITSNDSAI